MARSGKTGVVTVFLSVLALAPAAAAPRIVTIDYPGALSTYVFGTNPAGDIVGSFVDASQHERGFVLSGGVFSSPIDWPGSTWTEAWGINASGTIVGQYGWFENGIRTVHGFRFDNGVLSPIDIAGQPNTMPVKIAANGTIVGCYHVGTPSGATILDTMYGFVMTADGAVTSEASSRTMNNGVNPQGDVVGFYYSPATNRPEQSYLIQNGGATWFQLAGVVSTQAWDVSPNGTIVGTVRSALTGPNQFHGLIIRDGEMGTFDVPGATMTRAYGVNPAGDIVGYYGDAAGITHGFVLTKRGPAAE